MPKVFPSCLNAVAIALAAPAAAQDPPPPGSPDILVTGNPEVEAQIRDFVAALTAAPPRTQIGRFEIGVCPVAVGLSESQRSAVARRMRQVAEGAGLAVGDADCTPNVVVAVTPNKRAFLEGLRQRHSYYFSGLSSPAIRRLTRGPGPAAAWHVQGPPRNASGVELQSDGGSDLVVNRTITPGSRITAAARPQFAAAMVVVESGALSGLSTTQLADYAAMRAYARLDPSGLGALRAPTILTVLEAPEGSVIPITLTRWDLAFLRGLYSSPHNFYSQAVRAEIRRAIESEIVGTGEGRQ
ncbi:hypothetical protein [Sphingosinicella terrae]|uniref:hypothetical protein n=1 Tax=Sphingosinicella terrae TaxID=2172047 RepID=UPI000E0D18AC|nr:hypothetical protein [Sphingosinicella terrae]